MGVSQPLNPLYQSWSENIPVPETSTSMDGAQSYRLENGNSGDTSKSTSRDTSNVTDSKVLRRLAQNREAARKSRLRKKAYVQQLETSRVKLNRLEQELERVRQQGTNVSDLAMTGDAVIAMSKSNNSGVAAFNVDYARWLEEQNRQLLALRNALANHASDDDLRILIENGKAHYDELFRLKDAAVKADVFHIISGIWRTPAERCFMWMGGFRPSELLKILIPLLEPLSEQQLLALCDLQQSSQQAEDALSQTVECLQQNLGDTLGSGFLGDTHVTNFMGQMSMAMGKLETLERLIHQADNIRHQAFQQMHTYLTIHQAARGLIALGDYISRLRALSSLWMARPKA